MVPIWIFLKKIRVTAQVSLKIAKVSTCLNTIFLFFFIFDFQSSNSLIFFECWIFEISSTRFSPVTVVHILILQFIHTNKRQDSAFCCLRVKVKVFQKTFSTTKKKVWTLHKCRIYLFLVPCIHYRILGMLNPCPAIPPGQSSLS